jgi:hypothetical protein
VAKVRHFLHPEHALGALDNWCSLKLGENQTNMAQLFRPQGVVDQDVVEENEYKLTHEQFEDIFH